MIATIISTLIGGLLALAGAFVGPFLQRKHDRWLAMRSDHQQLRQKAEELFAELSVLTKQSGQATVRVLEQLKDKDLQAIAVPDLERIRALSTVYFPKLLPHVAQFEKDQKDSYSKIIPDLGKAGEAADAAKIQALGVIFVMEYQTNASKLARAVQLEMIEITPKFDEIK